MAVLVCSPLLGRQTCRIPGAGWPANLSRLVNSSSVKEIRLKKSGRASEEDTCCWPLEYTVVVTSESSMCLYTYQHTQAHTRTCTHSPPHVICSLMSRRPTAYCQSLCMSWLTQQVFITHLTGGSVRLPDQRQKRQHECKTRQKSAEGSRSAWIRAFGTLSLCGWHYV